MIIVGVVTTFLVGFLVLNSISSRFSLIEKAGLSFLLGIASQTLLMLLLDSLTIRLNALNILIASYLLILLLSVKVFWHRKKPDSPLPEIRPELPLTINLVWLFFIALILYLEYMNWTKCMFYPTFDRDSLAGFDTIGWIISQEQTLKGLSIFQEDYMSGIHNPGSCITYIPMIQLSYAYVYALGMETSKLIPALIYAGFLISFYGASKHFCGCTGAAIATFFVLVTPEMLAFSSLSATNVIHASYASLGVIYVVLWLKKREQKYFLLSLLLLAFNVWTRNEGVVFVGATALVVGLCKSPIGSWKNVLLYIGIGLLPLMGWVVFMKVNGLYAEGVFIFHPFLNKEKMQVIQHYFTALLTATSYYGISFWAFGVALLVNIHTLLKQKDLLALIGVISLSLLLYAIILYQIEYKWDSIENVLAYSAKRFLFCYIPLVWLYTLSNPLAVSLLEKMDKTLSF